MKRTIVVLGNKKRTLILLDEIKVTTPNFQEKGMPYSYGKFACSNRHVHFSLQPSFSKPQMKHLISIAHGIILCEGRKSIIPIQRAAGEERHLSASTHFLNEPP